MIEPMWFFMGVAIPGILSQAFYVTYCWPVKTPRPGRTACAWAVGPAAAFVLGCQAVGGFSGVSAEQRFLLYLLPVITLLAVAGAVGWLKGKALDGAKALVCLVIPSVLLTSQYLGDSPSWGTGAAAGWLAGAALWLGASWLSLAKLSETEEGGNGRLNAFVLGLTVAMTGVTLMMCGNLKWGQILATLAFATGTVWGVSWLTDKAQASKGFEGLVAPVWLTWVLMSFFLTEVSACYLLILAGSPMLLWLGRLPIVRAKKLKGQIALGALALAPAVTVTVMAVMEFLHKAKEMEY